MGGRDHACEDCGRGGFNDPDGECECPPEAWYVWRHRETGAIRATGPGPAHVREFEPLQVVPAEALATALHQLEEAETTIRFADKRFEIAEARCSSLEAAIREAEGLLDDIQGNLMSGDREVIAEIEATLRAALADSDQEERA